MQSPMIIVSGSQSGSASFNPDSIQSTNVRVDKKENPYRFFIDVSLSNGKAVSIEYLTIEHAMDSFSSLNKRINNYRSVSIIHRVLRLVFGDI